MIRPRLLLLIFLCFTWLTYAPSDAKAQDSPPSPIFPLPALEPITAENAARLQELAVIGRGTLASADLSPDGNLLAVGTTAGVWFYDFNDLSAEPVYLYTGVGFNSDVQFDVTGQYLQVVTYWPDVGGSTSMLWRLEDDVSQSERIGEGHLAGNGRYLRMADDTLTDTRSQEHFSLDFTRAADFEDDNFAPSLWVFAVSPDNRLLAVTESHEHYAVTAQMRVFDLDSQRLLTHIELERQDADVSFSSMVFSADGTSLISTVVETLPDYSARTTIYRWPVAALLQGEPLTLEDGVALWQTTDQSVVSLSAIDDRLLIETRTQEYERMTEVISLPDGTLQAQIAEVIVLVDAADGDLYLLEAESREAWRVRHHATDEIIGMLTDFSHYPQSFQLSPDQSQALKIASWSERRDEMDIRNVSIQLWEMQGLHILKTLHFTNPGFLQTRFLPDGRAVLMTLRRDDEQQENYFEIIDIVTEEVIYTFPEAIPDYPYVSLNENATLLLIAAGDQRWLYDISRLDSPQLLALPAPELDEISTYLSPDGHYLIQVERRGSSRFLVVWDVKAEQEVARINNRRIEASGSSPAVYWIPDAREGELLVLCERMVGTNDHLLSLWRFDKILSDPYVTPAMMVGPNWCQFSVSDHTLIVPTYGQGIGLWNILSRDRWFPGTFGDNEKTYWRLAKTSPDGSVLFGINYIGPMTVWSLNDAEAIATFDFVPWPVIDLLFMDEGRLLVMPGSDGTIRLWGVPVEDER